jgi:hypothetical protein
MRARYPDADGYIERDGIKVLYFFPSEATPDSFTHCVELMTNLFLA